MCAVNEWVFGLDGGGTHSRIRAESLSGDKLYEGTGGGMNPNSSAPTVVEDTLRELITAALSTGLSPRTCRAGFIGCAGVDRPSDRISMIAGFKRAFRIAAGEPGAPELPNVAAGNDAEPALAGALADAEGFLLIAGTGSIAYGRARSGRCERAGGWGHFLGDEGSAFWISFEGLKRGIRSIEGRDAPSALLGCALEFFGLSDAFDLIPFAYSGFNKAKIASFAPRVAKLAEQGDALAAAIMDEAAGQLAALVLSVYNRLVGEVANKKLAFYGGLMEKNKPLRSAVAKLLVEDIPGLEIIEPLGDALSGACRLARELLDRPPE